MSPWPTPPPGCDAAAWKRFLQESRAAYRRQLKPHFAVEHWIRHWTRLVDALLCRWAQQLPPDVSLYALGGHGRGELYPNSDLDLLFLSPTPEALKPWLPQLWQWGLRPSPRVLRPDEWRALAAEDMDFLTSLLEARHLAGRRRHLDWQSRPPRPLAQFVDYKIQEAHRRARHAFGRLEPDIKNDAGGLREVHLLGWLQRYSGLAPDFTAAEQRQLRLAHKALARLRFALHILEPRGRDVLGFAQQKQLAELFNPREDARAAVEDLMRGYYRHQRRLQQLSRQYLNQLQQHLRPPEKRFLDADFYLAQNLLHFQGSSLDVAQLWQALQHALLPEVEDLAPALSRLIAGEAPRLFSRRKALIREHFQHFLAFLRQKPLFKAGQLLHRHGLLQRLLPDFWQIVGRMQFDLFHQYTVDQHSLRLLHYFERFAERDEALYPWAQAIMARLPRPDILALAALMHDMAKGQPGDHSEIGAQWAQRYARFGGLDAEESALLVFLVRHHLTLSWAAQKQDIHSPALLQKLCALLPRPDYLDYWYLLTLADISATAESLWNSWRAQLLSSLYRHLRRALGLEPPPIAAPREMAWPRDFFLGKEERLWREQMQVLQAPDLPLLDVRETRILLLSEGEAQWLFSLFSHFVERHHGTIVEARLYRHPRGWPMQEYRLQEALPRADWAALRRDMAGGQRPQPLKKRLPRPALQHFSAAVHLDFQRQADGLQLQLSCQDRHGLLSCLSRVFIAEGVSLQHAKINTFGERAEDAFRFAPLSAAAQGRLVEHLQRALRHFYGDEALPFFISGESIHE